MADENRYWYKGFLIIEHPGADIKAYRNPEYYRSDVASYGSLHTDFEGMSVMIDEANDEGDFTEEEYDKVLSERVTAELSEPARRDGGDGAGGRIRCSGCGVLLDKVVASFAVLGWDESASEYSKVEDTGDFQCPHCGHMVTETRFTPPGT